VNKALEKDVEKRYQRAGQMSDHLRKLNEMIDIAIEQKKIFNTTKYDGIA
jgi:serine/threonine-protein kinase